MLIIAIIKIKYYLQFCVTFFALKTFLLNFSWQGLLFISETEINL